MPFRSVRYTFFTVCVLTRLVRDMTRGFSPTPRNLIVFRLFLTLKMPHRTFFVRMRQVYFGGAKDTALEPLALQFAGECDPYIYGQLEAILREIA